MPWEYVEPPVAMQLPPCNRCGNRGSVSQVAVHVYACADCRPIHVFAAIYRKEPAVRVLPARKAAAG
jgi:ribosomal protein L37AE/L43A